MKNYPYFLYPLISELKYSTDPERTEELMSLIAANVGDYDALASITGILDFDIRSFYPDRHHSPHTTEDTIDTFIAKFSSNRAPVSRNDFFLENSDEESSSSSLPES